MGWGGDVGRRDKEEKRGGGGGKKRKGGKRREELELKKHITLHANGKPQAELLTFTFFPNSATILRVCSANGDGIVVLLLPRQIPRLIF